MDEELTGSAGRIARIDLHCHTSASFDSSADPAAVVMAAAARGLTHLAITDHDTLDGALRARDAAPAGITVIVGQECRTSDGDLILLFVERLIEPGRPAFETAADARAQGAVVGLPHPYDAARNSILARGPHEELAGHLDYVETFNARLVGKGNERAARYALARSLPGVSVSDAHAILEVAIASTELRGEPSTAAGLRAALAAVQRQTPTGPVSDERGNPIARLVAGVRALRRRGSDDRPDDR
jgi:hypothetical protein